MYRGTKHLVEYVLWSWSIQSSTSLVGYQLAMPIKLNVGGTLAMNICKGVTNAGTRVAHC